MALIRVRDRVKAVTALLTDAESRTLARTYSREHQTSLVKRQ